MGRDSLIPPSPKSRSEPKVGRPSRSFHILTLLLTTLLAWPWNLAFSIAEASQIADQVRLARVSARGTPEIQRPKHSDRGGDPSISSVMAPDFDWDENDDEEG